MHMKKRRNFGEFENYIQKERKISERSKGRETKKERKREKAMLQNRLMHRKEEDGHKREKHIEKHDREK